MLKQIISLFFLTSVIVYAQSSVGLNINETDLEIEGIIELSSQEATSTHYQADINYLNADSHELVGAGFGVANQMVGYRDIGLTFGAKMVWSDRFNENYSALPLMAKVTFSPTKSAPLSFEGKILYAPKVLSFGNADKYREMRIEGNLELIRNVKIYAGYRNIDTDYKNFDYSFNDSFFGGLKILF